MLLLQGRISPPKNITLCVIGRVRFERNCGKMYSRHLFPYGGLFLGSLLGTSLVAGSEVFQKLTRPSLLVSLSGQLKFK